MVIYIRYGLTGAFAGEHAGREIPSFSSNKDSRNTTRVSELSHRPSSAVLYNFATFAVPDTAVCDLKVESRVTYRSLFSRVPLDMNAKSCKSRTC